MIFLIELNENVVIKKCLKIAGIFICFFLLPGISLFGQKSDPVQFVNPLIGTTQTNVPSKWGSDGGTYPGAVAPWGAIQLSPETQSGQMNGYDFKDTSISYFTCIRHKSGYPGGSGGDIRVMPVFSLKKNEDGGFSRPFSHQDEKAGAGYYRVLFRDNNTQVEVSASPRTGMFMFTFPEGVNPLIYIGDAGKLNTPSTHLIEGSKANAVFQFDRDFISKKEVGDGYIFSFQSEKKGKNIILLKLSTSSVGFKSALANLSEEADGWDFDLYRKNNRQRWTDALSVIDVHDPSVTNKTIFYTALYHSMLVPWVSSDTDGNYRGTDGKIYQTNRSNEYTVFSPWDTFRFLHPLLCLIAPDRQNDMICSLLDYYKQSGKLPKGPMTGNHVLAIIVDSYLKGIKNYDSTLVYKAMLETLDEASLSPDFAAYRKLGYVPSSYSESVTKTVEFAYNDWVLAQFAGKVMDKKKDCGQLLERSYNYRNLFYPDALALVPRNGDIFVAEPGNFGYKEGDKWSYSLFVPHNPIDLINLMGGKGPFAKHLDSALQKQLIVFDNEPVLHVPYLFNYADRPDKTQQWVRNILKTHYLNLPDGLPGNDDLGSMSSWYVFSAMGFAPFCPGRPVYMLGSPLFDEVIINLPGKKNFVIRALNNADDHVYVNKISLNGNDYQNLWIDHKIIANGGELNFQMGDIPSGQVLENSMAGCSETGELADIKLDEYNFSKQVVVPDEPFFVHFSLTNSGSPGTKIVSLYVDGKEYNRKNIFLEKNGSKTDSMECRLYPVGLRSVSLDNLPEKKIKVVSSGHFTKKTEMVALDVPGIVKTAEPFLIRYKVQNKNGFNVKDTILVCVDGIVVHQDIVNIGPGLAQMSEFRHVLNIPGFHKIDVANKQASLKVYSENQSSVIINLTGSGIVGDTIFDQSGLLNNGFIRKEEPDDTTKSDFVVTGDNVFVELNSSESTDKLGEKITIMAWVKPTGVNEGAAAIITKGDFIALQADARSLSFFAGGWGRGEVAGKLPENWLNNWHHIAGVSDGESLKLYIDGNESGYYYTGKPVNLSNGAHWMIGRNEEFPGERIFYGKMASFKVFIEPLIQSEIKKEMKASSPTKEK